MTKVPDFTPEKWESWLKDKTYAEERVEHLEDELDKALDEQDRLSRSSEDLRSERDAEKRLRVQAENDARRAKAAADQAAAAAAAASRSLKIGEKQLGGAKDGEKTQELRVEIQQLKAKNHGLNTQMDALALDHERLAGLLAAAEKDKISVNKEARQLRESISALEGEKETLKAEAEAKKAEREVLAASSEALKAEAAALEAQNQRLGDELDRLAGKSGKKKSGGGADPAELAAAIKARKEAEEHTAMIESQLSELQVELRTVREELATLQDEAELKAGAAREGIAAADAQAAAVTKELTVVKAELITIRENERPATHGVEIESLKTELGARKMELEAMRQKAIEADALCKEAEAKATASETRAMELHQKVSEIKAKIAGKDEDGMTAQLMETMALLKDAEIAKRTAEDELASKNERIEELESQIASHGPGEAHHEGKANGDNSSAKISAMQSELDDFHDMLDKVSSERDAALNELRNATEGNLGNNGEVQGLREECHKLQDHVRELVNKQGSKEGDVPQRDHGGEDDVARTGPKRVKSLEDQVERLAEEHTRQSESWREMSAKMEREKEELSQELIGAKLQVAQLYMEVDGIKLRHRQAALATASALVIEDDDVVSPTSSARTSPPPSPNSPITMQL